MRNLSADWSGIVKRLARAPAVAVATDFDGTLTPIRRSPAAPRLSAGTQALLRRLAARPGTTLAVVSGRSLRDLARRVRIPGAILIGNHGLETRPPGGTVRRAYGAGELRSVRAAARSARAALRGVPGLRWEDKGPVIAVHFRGAPAPSKRRAVAALAEAAAGRRPAVRAARGKEVAELRPAGRTDKGRALRAAWRRAGVPPGAMRWYFGDDATDEDVFLTLPRGAVTVHVGPASDRSAARWYVRTTTDVRRRLAAVLRVRSSRTGAGS